MMKISAPSFFRTAAKNGSVLLKFLRHEAKTKKKCPRDARILHSQRGFASVTQEFCLPSADLCP